MTYKDYPSEKRHKEESPSENEDPEWDDKNYALTPETDTSNPYEYRRPSLPMTEVNSSSRTRDVTSRPRKPLIDFVKNEWRTDPRYHQMSPPCSPSSAEFEGFGLSSWRTTVRKPYFKRRLLGILVCSFVLWTSYVWWLAPAWLQWKESCSVRASLDSRIKTGKGWFGINMQPKFADIIQLEKLDRSLLPGEKGGKHEREKRLIIVGDVHGCVDELTYLLAKLSFNKDHDHLILTGDLISKGPSSGAVVDLAVSLNASCVRGNHEDRILLAHRDLHKAKLSHHASTPGPSNPLNNERDQSLSKGDHTDRELAASLSSDQITYLSSCPLILLLGPIKGLGPQVSIVHAGLLPGVPLERQDPTAVMTMRSVDLDTHVPSPDPPEAFGRKSRKVVNEMMEEKGRKSENRKDRKKKKKDKKPKESGSVPWTTLWNRYQSLRPKHLHQTVIYGHDSRQGLTLKKYSMGLDSGCVRGGRLTALVIESDRRWWKSWKEGRGVRTRVVSVGCKDYKDIDH